MITNRARKRKAQQEFDEWCDNNMDWLKDDIFPEQWEYIVNLTQMIMLANFKGDLDMAEKYKEEKDRKISVLAYNIYEKYRDIKYSESKS